MADPYLMTPRRPTHYSDTRDAKRTPCGVKIESKMSPVYVDGNFTEQRIYKPKLSTDMDTVTCKRCIASWNKFLREWS